MIKTTINGQQFTFDTVGELIDFQNATQHNTPPQAPTPTPPATHEEKTLHFKPFIPRKKGINRNHYTALEDKILIDNTTPNGIINYRKIRKELPIKRSDSAIYNRLTRLKIIGKESQTNYHNSVKRTTKHKPFHTDQFKAKIGEVHAIKRRIMKEQGTNISDSLKQAWKEYKNEHPNHQPYMKNKKPLNPITKTIEMFTPNQIKYRRCEGCNAHFGRTDDYLKDLEKKLPALKSYCETCINRAGISTE